jgi:hypothetical protein
MGTGMKIVNNRAFVKIQKAYHSVPEGCRLALIEVGPIINRTMINRIYNPAKSGKTYMIDGQLHQASAPGESPAMLTGELA